MVRPLVLEGVAGVERPLNAPEYDPSTQRLRGPRRLLRSATGEAAVLILTQRFDPHADVVIDALEHYDVTTLRLNSEDLHRYVLTWHGDESAPEIADAFGRSIHMGVARSCYFRRTVHSDPHAKADTAEAIEFSAREAEAFVEAMSAVRGTRWVSRPSAIAAAESKPVQLSVARELGLLTPRTIVTNDPMRAREFATAVNSDLIVKTLRTTGLRIGDIEFDIPARRLTKSDFVRRADAVSIAPTVVQEYVPKVAEVRVTVMGPEVFAVRQIPMVAHPDDDWTRMSTSDLSYEPVMLSHHLTERVRAFLNSYGLLFGALDFVETPDGSLIFLENNPNGVWYWLERETRLPMADAMARLLIGSDGGS